MISLCSLTYRPYVRPGIDMKNNDKVIAIVSIMTALVLVYMLQPEPVSGSCYEWDTDLGNRFDALDVQFTANVSESEAEEMSNEWMTLQRESLIHTTACDLFNIVLRGYY